METTRVDIVYRPLRVGFVVISEDLASFRKAVRMCHALWGGRYNPIIAVDRPEAAQLVEVFRPDFLLGLDDNPSIAAFISEYPYLINPLFGDELFRPRSRGERGESLLIDVQNLIAHVRETGTWKRTILDQGFRVMTWATDDPLADVFLSHFGGYPEPAETGIDYGGIVSRATSAVDVHIAPDGSVPPDTLDHPGISYLSRYQVTPHYTSNASENSPGLYVGSATSGVDLINYWNLRACGIGLHFVDLSHRLRTAEFESAFTERLRVQLSGLDEFRRLPAIWYRNDAQQQATEVAAGGPFLMEALDEAAWNGFNIRPQRMHFGEESSLGVLGGSEARPRVTFALREKPFSNHIRHHQQHLIASISLLGGRSDGIDYTFIPPCVPELNEFASREMHYDPSRLRLERESVGVVIDVTERDLGLTALSAPKLIEKIFALAGYSAKPSRSGLIARQLITRMGGVDGARAFKIPGVRKLFKTHGPSSSFTRQGALQLIGATDPATGSKFKDHAKLYIERRETGTDLTPGMVFSHLVEKGLFRIGVDLKCPACALTSWIALDGLKQSAVCPLCGNSFDATRQLVEGGYTYRRSGVLGLEKNTQGAVPVSLLLQQLSVNLMTSRYESIFGVSHDLVPNDPHSGLPTCETDFCILTKDWRSDKTTVLIGECKDVGGTIDGDDIDRLKRVAEALPNKRFNVFIVLAKLAPFSPEEIALAKALNSEPWTRRVIMLTARELEPYRLFARTNVDLGLKLKHGSAEDLANATYDIYFSDTPKAKPATG